MGVKDTVGDITASATGFFEKNKTAVIGGIVGAVVFIIILCCCCIKCRMKKKKKKEAEKIKLKGAKPGKKLKRIQPSKTERKVMEELGTIKGSLSFDNASSMLTVKVIEAEDVPVRDLSGYAYSFVVVRVMPFHEHEEAEYKTNFVRAGFWPSYGDAFNFVIDKDALKSQMLYFYLYELNRWSKQDGIGQASFELKDYDLLRERPGDIEIKKKLRPYDPLLGLEVETGAVFLTMEYDSENWELKIEIRQADIIPQDEDKDKCHSYVTLAMENKDGERMEKRKSSSKSGTLQPFYEDEVSFSIPDNIMPEARLLIKLKQKRLLRPTTLIGKTVILPTADNWKQLLEKDYTEGWFSVFNKPAKDKN